MNFYADLVISVDAEKVDDWDARLDQFLDALSEIEDSDPQITDIDLTATLATGEVSVTMYIEGGDMAEAGQKLVATTRAALHKIGDRTPGWEYMAQMVHEACMNVRTVKPELADA